MRTLPPLFKRKAIRPRPKTSGRKRSKVTTAGPSSNPFEWVEQATVCNWLDVHGVLYHSVPNDGERSPHMAVRARDTGLKPGVPDLCICAARKGYNGLYIEMKRRTGGITSPLQKAWIENLLAEGYLAVVCHGASQAISILEDYFS